MDKVLDNPNIMRSLIKFSGLDPEVIRQQFIPGNGPEIAISELYGAYGDTPQDNQGLLIRLSQYYTINPLMEAIRSGDIDKYDDALFMLILTILHEYTHSGDLQIHGRRYIDLDQPPQNCQGYQWEFETFGEKFFERKDVQSFLRKPANNIERRKGNSTQNKNTTFWNNVSTLKTGNYIVTDEGEIVPK